MRATENVREINSESVWGVLHLKKKFPETITHKISETNSGFHIKWHKTGKV